MVEVIEGGAVFMICDWLFGINMHQLPTGNDMGLVFPGSVPFVAVNTKQAGVVGIQCMNMMALKYIHGLFEEGSTLW